MANDPWGQYLQPPVQPAQAPAVSSDGSDPWGSYLNKPVIDQDQDRKLTNLPAPHPGMFKDMDPETAKIVYNSYANHPNSETTKDGQLLYNGVPVPKPGENTGFVNTVTNVGNYMLTGMSRPVSWAVDRMTGSTDKSLPDYLLHGNEQTTGVGGLSNDLGTGTAGGAVNAVHNTATGVASLVGTGVDKVAGAGTSDKAIKAIDETLPAFNAKNSTQNIAATTSEIGAGLIAGNAAAGAALKASGWAPEAVSSFVSKAPKVAKYFGGLLAHATAGGMGMALTTSGEGKTLLAGPNAQFPIVQDYAPFLKGLQGKTQSEAQNILEKRMNVVLDNIAIAMPVGAAADTAKGVMHFAWEGFIKPLFGAANPRMQEQLIGNGIISDLARLTKTSDNDVPALRDKMVDLLSDPKNRQILLGDQEAGQLVEGVEGISPVATKLDTATTVSRGLANAADDTEEAQALRHGMFSHRKAVIGNEGNLTELATNRPTNDLSKLTFQTQNAFGGEPAAQTAAEGLQKVGQEEAGAARAGLEETQQKINTLNAAYPNIVAKNALGNAVTETADEPLSAATQTKNALTQKIDQNVARGIKTTNENVGAAWKNIPEGLQVTNPQRLEESLVNAQNYLTPAMTKVVKDAVKFGEDGEVQAGDFSKLQQLRKPLSDAIDNAIGTPAYGPLKDLRQNLFGAEGEAADIAKSGQPGAEKVQEAVNAYKAGSQTKSGYVGDIENANQNLRFDEPKRADTVAGIIQNGVKSGQPNQIAHFADVLSKPEFGSSHDLLPQLMKADIADDFRTQLKSNGGIPDVPSLLNKIQQYRQMLNAPQYADQAKSFDEFANQIIQNKSDVKALEGVLEGQTEQYGEVADKIHSDVLKHFFESNVNQPVTDGMEAFKNLFKDSSNGKQLDYILSKAQDKPEVMDGIRAAYSKTLDDTLFSGAENTGGGGLLKKNATDNGVLKVGDKIFTGKYAPIMDAVRQLSDPAMENQIAKSVGASKASPEGVTYTTSKAATNKLIQLAFGPLSKIGARIGAISGTLLEKLDPGGAAKQIKDVFFSDPDEAIRILNSLKYNTSDPQVKRQMFQLLVNNGLYTQQDYPAWEKAVQEQDTKQQTQDALKKGQKKTPKE